MGKSQSKWTAKVGNAWRTDGAIPSAISASGSDCRRASELAHVDRMSQPPGVGRDRDLRCALAPAVICSQPGTGLCGEQATHTRHKHTDHPKITTTTKQWVHTWVRQPPPPPPLPEPRQGCPTPCPSPVSAPPAAVLGCVGHWSYAGATVTSSGRRPEASCLGWAPRLPTTQEFQPV
jgi:hypothetical protein